MEPYYQQLGSAQPSQTQIIIYQNITEIIYQPVIDSYRNSGAPRPYMYISYTDILLILLFGILLGVFVTFCYQFLKDKKKEAKDPKIVVIKNEPCIHPSSNKSTTGTENSGNSIHEKPEYSKCSSTESTPKLSYKNESHPEEIDVPTSQRAESFSQSCSNELACITPLMFKLPSADDACQANENVLELKRMHADSDITDETDYPPKFRSSSIDDYLTRDSEELLKLRFEQESRSSEHMMNGRVAIAQENYILHNNSNYIHSTKEELDIRIRRVAGKLIKTETKINTTVYDESKNDDLEERINYIKNYCDDPNVSLALIQRYRANLLGLPHVSSDVCICPPENITSPQDNASSPETPFAMSKNDVNSKEVSKSSQFNKDKSKDQHSNSSKDNKSSSNSSRSSSSSSSTSEVSDNTQKKSQSQSREKEKIKNSESAHSNFEVSNNSTKTQRTANQGFPHLNGFFDTVFVKETLVGKGGFGKVYKAMHKLEQKLYAIKKVKLFVKEGEDLRQNKLFREVLVMTSLHHSSIVRHHTTWTEEPAKDYSSEAFIKRTLSNKKLSTIKRFEESKSIAKNNEHTRISDLGFEWEEPDSAKLVVQEDSSDSSSLESESQSRIRSINKTQSELLQSESSDDELNSSINRSIINKLKDHQLVYLFIQMEYCSGDNLSNYLENRSVDPTRREIVHLFKQILEGVMVIHENGIIHRDLKPSNIFLEKNHLKIGDFGLSYLGDKETNELESLLLSTSPLHSSSPGRVSSPRHTSNIGTPFYISPEQQKFTTYDYKTDIFSLGIILFEITTRFSTVHERRQRIGALREHKKVDIKHSDFGELVLKMIHKDPKLRPSAKEALAILEKLPLDDK